MPFIDFPRILIAGTHSGVGKTTLTVAIMKGLSNRGHQVQAYKTGPDFIDPTFHTVVTGRPSRNLDSWMLDQIALQEVFEHGIHGASMGIIEGVMGLYDGYHASSLRGSAAEISLWFQAPIILVIDASSMARSAAAVVLGFQKFDPNVPIRGVIANRVNSEGHFQLLQEAIEQECGIPLLGYFPYDTSFQLPERHLGLIPALEQGEFGPLFDLLASQVERTVDMNRLEQIALSAPPLHAVIPELYAIRHQPKVKIAVAKDQAFNFYYEDNLDLLQTHGAFLEFFSPLAGEPIPEDADGLYIGGGFPEEFAEKLSCDQTYRKEFRKRIESGLPTYAECGGYMYLTESIVSTNGQNYPMIGAIPAETIMQKRLARLGYTSVTALHDHLLLPKGEQARGHEFHYSTMTIHASDYPFAYQIEAYGKKEWEGYHTKTLLASYVHLHFASNPRVVNRFLEHCANRHL